MHVKGRKPGLKTKQRTDLVVDAGKVRPVCDIEPLRGELQVHPLAQFVLPGQARVEINEIGTKTGVAGRSDRALIGRVAVAIDFSSRQQVKRMSAGIGENGRKLKS